MYPIGKHRLYVVGIATAAACIGASAGLSQPVQAKASGTAPTVPVAAPTQPGPAPTTRGGSCGSLRRGSRHELFVNGRIGAPMPRLTSDVQVRTKRNGTARVVFAVTYSVSNTSNRKGVLADQAVINLSVGPANGAPVYRLATTDGKLNRCVATRSYSLTIPRSQVRYLKAAGLKSGKSAVRRTALQGVKLEVHQRRDFKYVNGTYDWKQGLGFDGTTRSTRTAGNEPATYITVTNSTGSGVYNYIPPPSLEVASGGSYEDGYQAISGAPAPAQQVVTSGAALSCVYNVGDVNGSSQSNPQGFNTTLNYGESVTNFVITNTKGSADPSSTDDLAGVSASTVSAVQYGLKAMAPFVPFLGPVLSGLAWGLWYVGRSGSCESYPTVMNLSAYTQDGLGGNSTNWNLTNVGLQNIYATPYTSTEWDANQVQLAQDTENDYPPQAPTGLWLAQQIVDPQANNCGTQSGSVSCNVPIDLIWTTNPPCPYTDGYLVNGGRQGGLGNCFLSQPTSPEVTGCGTNNSGCPAYPAPSSASATESRAGRRAAARDAAP